MTSVTLAPRASLTRTTAKRRSTYRRVSKSTSESAVGFTKSCATSGSVARAESPRSAAAASVGTSRQPRTSICISAQAASTAATHAARPSGSPLGR